jgi:hypothetical protein
MHLKKRIGCISPALYYIVLPFSYEKGSALESNKKQEKRSSLKGFDIGF